MTRTALAALAAIFLASSASAGSITFSIPNLWFPPSDDTTVTRLCTDFDATSEVCDEEG